jgi:hypothetical protein
VSGSVIVVLVVMRDLRASEYASSSYFRDVAPPTDSGVG